MAGNVRIVPVGDTPVRLSSPEGDSVSGQSVMAIPIDGSVTYGYNDQITFGAGVRMGTDTGVDQMAGVEKSLQSGESLWAVADTGVTVQVVVDETGI